MLSRWSDFTRRFGRPRGNADFGASRRAGRYGQARLTNVSIRRLARGGAVLAAHMSALRQAAGRLRRREDRRRGQAPRGRRQSRPATRSAVTLAPTRALLPAGRRSLPRSADQPISRTTYG
jgi:hypothetical protein